MAKTLEPYKDLLDSKLTSVTDSMQRKPEWKGCLTKLEFESDNDRMQHALNIGSKDRNKVALPRSVLDKGAVPNLLVTRPHKWRAPSCCAPFQGLPCGLYALTDGIVITVFDIHALVSKGVAIDDLESHLEAPSGAAYMEKHVVVFPLPKNQAFCVAPGLLWSFGLEGHPHSEAELDELGFVVHFPIFDCLPEMTKVTSQAMAALRKLNTEQLTDPGRLPAKVWKPKAELWAKFDKELAVLKLCGDDDLKETAKKTSAEAGLV